MDIQSKTIRAAVPWAVFGIVAVLALGAYFRFGSGAPLGVDTWWSGITGATRGTMPYAVAVFFAQVGASVGTAALTAIAAALLLVRKRPRDAGALVTALAIGLAGSEIIKMLVMRPRPPEALYETTGSDYPSGHSMGAAALACSLALIVAALDDVSRNAARWAWVGAFAWVLIMMWSRTALHAHWLSDTVAGALLGLSAAVLARALWAKRPASAATLDA